MEEKGNELVICPECGGDMEETGSEPDMMKCVSCGHEISIDDAKAQSLGDDGDTQEI